MKVLVTGLLTTILAATLTAGTALAQGMGSPTLAQPMDSEYYTNYSAAEEQPDGESPSDVQPEPPAPLVEGDADAIIEESCGAVKGCGDKGCGKGCGAAPWTLPQPCVLQNMGVAVGGWWQQGVTFNGNDPANGFNGPVATNDWDGEYQMNQLWVFLHRPADNGGSGFAMGGHVDMLLGTDWRFGVNHGLENRINGFNYQSYGVVLPQLYLEFAINRLSIKVGHFAGLMDYEAVPAIANPFYSHSYSYGYTVDQLVTGALAEYQVNDQFSVLGGITRGWMMFEDLNHHLDFICGLRWKSPDGGTSLAYSITAGPQDPVVGDQERFAYSLVYQRQFTEKLKYVLVHNLGIENDGAPNRADAEWYGINQYFLYQVSPKWAWNLRFEWLRDDDGTRVAGPGIMGVIAPGVLPDVRAYDGMGFAGNFFELTLGANWRPHPNFLIRPECRWDWYDGLPGVYARTAQAGQPFNDGNSDKQFTFGVDMVITY